MAQVHNWWKHRTTETAWLEVTRRIDIGVNLKSPQANEDDSEYWSYALIKSIKEGDTVFHYDGTAQAIVGRSLAVGKVWEDEIVWAARGLSARSANIEPHLRPGWYLALESFEPFAPPVELSEIRNEIAAVRSLVGSLVAEVGQPLYFPFELGKRPMRPLQGYIFKLPRAFLDLFGLKPFGPSVPVGGSTVSHGLGNEYRRADEFTAVAQRDPFAVDPAVVERGIRGHATTQNRLAAHLRELGIEPRSPKLGEPNFDLAWQIGECVFVAEVKSLTSKNEEKQLRLGLGQVLRYAQLLRHYSTATPVLVAERRPDDSGWSELCEQLGVVLVWPEVFSERFRKEPSSGPGQL